MIVKRTNPIPIRVSNDKIESIDLKIRFGYTILDMNIWTGGYNTRYFDITYEVEDSMSRYERLELIFFDKPVHNLNSLNIPNDYKFIGVRENILIYLKKTTQEIREEKIKKVLN